MGASDLTEFSLGLVPAIDTGSVVKADQDGHLTGEQLSQTVDMSVPGFYTINIWAINEGNSNAVLASKYQVEIVENTETEEAPQIFFFTPEEETGYKAQEYTFTAETTGNVTGVELYIDGYLVTPEIELELWNGYQFYTLTAPIWEAGNRLCKLVVKTAEGKTAEASCYIDVDDAEYKKLPTPVLTNPLPYADGETRGVINSPFVLSWEENVDLSAAEIKVTITKDGKACFYQEVTQSNSLTIPDTVLTEVGLYSISVVATQIGYETSDFVYLPLRAYATEQAIIQDLCEHDAGRIEVNHVHEWQSPVSYDKDYHYSRVHYDLACELCGLVLEEDNCDFEEYQPTVHSLSNGAYCECGYCVGFGTNGEKAYLNKKTNQMVYRTPEDCYYGIGELYPYDQVEILYETNGMYYISYYSDVWNSDRYGFVSTSNIKKTIPFYVYDEKGNNELVPNVFTDQSNSLLVTLEDAKEAFDLTIE